MDNGGTGSPAGAVAGDGTGVGELVFCRDDAPKLLAALKEMKEGLDHVTGKVKALTRKVKKNQLPTADGIGYLEAKHHLLLSYCQDIVYYVLRKAKGLSVEGHPVVRSLVEIRLFLEKIRPIDKKMEYQIQKLTNAADSGAAQEKVVNVEAKNKDQPQDDEDLLKYRPNPDMMDTKTDPAGQDNDGVYRPPKFMATKMDDEDKRIKQAARRDKALERMAIGNPYIKEIIDDAADRPEELKETAGDESREFTRYMRQRELQEKQEEELFTRAPLTKRDKQTERQMRKQLHGLRGLTDGFDLGMNMILDEDKDNDVGSSKPHAVSGGRRKHQKGSAGFVHLSGNLFFISREGLFFFLMGAKKEFELGAMHRITSHLDVFTMNKLWVLFSPSTCEHLQVSIPSEVTTLGRAKRKYRIPTNIKDEYILT
uniref:Neuroguidin n=1 Tax=Leersia perrieri TaxID=77586 RepID=A0A0D9V9B9_9ORYZ